MSRPLVGEDLVGLLHTRTARTLWGRGKQLKDGRQKAKTVGEAVDFGGWGQEAKKEGSGGSSPKVREAEEPCLSQAALHHSPVYGFGG